MPINTQYYGAESTWLDFPPVAGMTDPFKTGQYSTVNHSTYGLATRTWLACKYGADINTYKQSLDPSFGWCITDGNAPFDHTYGVTGYNANHDRYELNQNGKNVIGLGAKGNQSAYISNVQYVQYYKSSANGGAEWGNAPLNFQPDYSFTPTIDSYSGGLKVMRCAGSGLSPVLKFDFGYYYMVPFIDYYVLKSTATIADWGAVTDPANYSALVDTSKRDDLYTFYTRINGGTYSADKIIINGVVAYMVHVAWHNDKTYDVTDTSFGSQTSTTCQVTAIHANDTPIDFTFNDWYDSTDPTQYNIKIDPVFINNRGFSVGSCGIYNGKTSTISSGQYNAQSAVLLAGCVDHYATGYTSPTSYCYYYQPVAMASTDFTVKTFSADSSLPNARRYGISVSATLSDFGGLDSFREYVRKCCAYFGCYFSEKFYPDATQEWLNADCFIGTIDSNGVTHGAYTQGTDNAQQPQRTWGDEWATKTPYEPGKPPKPDHDPNNYINGMPGTNQLSIASFTRLYAMTPNDLTYLRAYLKYIPTQYTDFDTYRDFLGQKFLNSNPIDNMVSLRWYPFDVVNNVMVFLPITQPIQISNATAQWTESGATYTVQGTTSLYPVYYFTLYLGSFTPQTAYGNFLDYEPYSDAKMYLPFCGTASIDLKSILDVTLYVSYKVDVRTGACTAIVAADDYDGNIILTAHGSLAVEIPITGVQSADYQNAVFQAINNLKNAQIAQFTAYVQSATGLIGAAATTAANPLAGIGAAGNAVSGIAGAMQAENNLKQAQYDLKTAQIKHTVVGSTSAGDGSMMYLYPALIVNRPTFIYGYNPDVYAHTVGNACILSDTLGAFTGFTVVSAIDLDNVQATETEKNMIRSILAAGIYL